MEDLKRRYLYSCRECSARQRCIDSRQLSPGAKMTIVRAFESRTDTVEMWDLLQQDCLLVREAKEQAAPKKRETSALIRRLRQARQAPEEEAPAPPAPPAEPGEPAIFAEREAGPALPPVEAGAEPEAALRWREEKPAAPPKPARKPAAPPKAAFYSLVIASTQRIIRLPGEGVIVLGRCEPGLGSPADVDLTYDERGVQSVSRHHARITGRDSQHWLEDMGSTNGTFLNDRQLPMGEKVKLTSGDRVMLGRCLLTYNPLPDWAVEPDARVPHIAILTITHTGYHIRLPAKSQLMLGRPDPAINYIPDIDLSNAGDIARHVSRRHARLTARSGLHFVEDIGSATGTRLNGKPIRLGDPPALLHPGDQLWLGGCVIAYEWRLSK